MNYFEEALKCISQALKDFSNHIIEETNDGFILTFLLGEKDIKCEASKKDIEKFRFIVKNTFDYTEIPLDCKRGKIILTYLPSFRRWVAVAFLKEGGE